MTLEDGPWLDVLASLWDENDDSRNQILVAGLCAIVNELKAINVSLQGIDEAVLIAAGVLHGR